VLRETFDLPEAAAYTDMYATYNQTTAVVGIDFNDTLSVAINTAFIEYFESVITNAHTELVNCWTAILTAYDEGRINLAELDAYAVLMGTPVSILDPKSSLIEQFTEEYALAINHDMIYDASYASDVTAAWTNAAKSQYISVMNAVNAET